jgi:RNA polymerase sigma factor (sigma-70 family)
MCSSLGEDTGGGGTGPSLGLGLGVDRAPGQAELAIAAVELLERHEPALRRVARRFSLCAADADDAIQRALEILLTKAPTDERRRLIAWMTVVTRHEALAVRRMRERALGPADVEPDGMLDLMPSEAPGPAESAERRDDLVAARRALAALKEDHRRAIVLQAQGYSYTEIAGLCGWTYTKVNRSLAEGRAYLRTLGQGGCGR